jgi:hypothetical protein
LKDKSTEGNEMSIKYVIRRAIAGIVIVPAVATAWFVIYAVLVGLGATPTSSPAEVWGMGVMLGITLTVYLMFFERINALFEKWGM